MPIDDVSHRTLAELISLTDRTAVVTGGARGIGRAIAARFAEAGAAVVIADVDADGAATAADEIVATGGIAIALMCDVTDPESINSLIDQCTADGGRIDIWVNNAGIFPSTPFLELSIEEWERVLRVNLHGAFFGARAAARQMVAQGHGGVIVNLASTSALRGGPPGMSHYSSAKHGLVGLTKSLAIELGPHRIRVLAVAPTRVLTEGIAELYKNRGTADDLEQVASSRVGGPTGMLPDAIPLGRTAFADDVARVVLFCSSDLAMLMTGSVLPVDAGILAI